MTASQLLAALDAAGSDSERQAILAGCTPEQLAQLSAALCYREFVNAPCPYAAFTAELDQAADDAERLQLIAAAEADPQRGPGWLSEWRWWRGASESDAARRYAALCGCEASP